MLALTSSTGKLGSAVLRSLLEHKLVDPQNLILLTSSSIDAPSLAPYKSAGTQARSINYESPTPETFAGATSILVVSTPRISMDFNNAPLGSGREKHHIAVINAAVAGGVKHIFYTSLAFGPHSEAGVMRAHLRTEAYLSSLREKGKVRVTVLREGLYNESWPLYLGYYDLKKDRERGEIVLGGDGKICWTSIPDLGLATALVISDDKAGEKYDGKTMYLSSSPDGAKTLQEIAELVGKERGAELTVKVVSREEHVRYYVEQKGMEEPSVEWWSSTYPALEKGECIIHDTTLTDLLSTKGVKPQKVEETVKEMLAA
ncbi:Uncharacterized protein BP5553_04141 [Venustampulla echinocandica]|uniref:NmrA-like domain-containing protein n=1 Tax=Venustampulla echinocandica TaxID=2656787 RepID=A0A370TW94_9HELO|nr:Uncharacterized protein BP5553_04141 [Venustampulla echinocandica]RDL39801.1 Uncharacterized protein BP5553_04141 [Venustampulla echinocandica]